MSDCVHCDDERELTGVCSFNELCYRCNTVMRKVVVVRKRIKTGARAYI